ncbi:MAG: MFS transporter [Planctomycetes bacterium]|nr:MFS transporter [Planctomycetota bacterium]
MNICHMNTTQSAAPSEATAQAAPAAGSPLDPSPLQRRGMRACILGQGFGCLAHCSFSNGLLLLFLTQLGISSASTITYLALPNMLQAVLLLPLAFLADRVGMKRLGIPGMVLTALGFLGVTLAASLDASVSHGVAFGGLTLYGLGWGLYGASWFALLSPVVPAHMRGRFFGTMRFVWQLAGLLFGIACSFLLSQAAPAYTYQIILGVIVVGLAIRVYFYARIPELEPPQPKRESLLERMGGIVRAPGYASFCCYAFLISLFTFNAPNLFGLVEKKTLHFSDGEVVWMGNLLMLGSIAGYYVGGKAIDRWGTKSVFLLCHFAFAGVLAAFLLRGLVPLPMVGYLGTLNLLFGMLLAASNVAISTEMLALIPAEGKSVSTALCMTLVAGGQAGSGFFAAAGIELGLFRESWSLLGHTLGVYDALLMIYGVMVFVMVVALGLVPSVLRKAEWAPRGM